MMPSKLKKLRRELDALRRRRKSIRSDELESLAIRIGRRRVKRGKEPTYERVAPGWFPLTIPSHPGTLPIGTACNILNQLEDDIERLEAEIEQEDEEDKTTGEGQDP